GRTYLAGQVPYAYHQIVLLAILSLTRRIPLPPVGRRLVRVALDQAAGVLNSLVEDGRQLMICSEFVYRCYDEAHAGAGPNPYHMNVLAAEFGAMGDTQTGQTLLGALGRDEATLPPVVVGPTFGSRWIRRRPTPRPRSGSHRWSWRTRPRLVRSTTCRR